MGWPHFMPQKRGPHHKWSAKVFWTALSAMAVIIIFLGAFIVWLLVTQDLSKATSIIEIIAAIVAIPVGPFSLLFTVLKWPEHERAAEHILSPNPQVRPPSVSIEPDTSLQPLQERSQTTLHPTTQKRRTAGTPGSTSGNSQAKEATLMAMQEFHVRGPLPGDGPLYIERKADHDVLLYLRKMDYISLIEPRQQGKTSLIYRLMRQLSPQGYTFVICDLGAERFRKNSEEEWYTFLGTWLLNKLSFVNRDAIVLPTQGTSWETFLIGIAEAAKEAKQKVVIVLDEIREMPSAYATTFFTVVRSIYNERAISPSFEYLTFITSGAFNPNELIQDENVSKFNVDQRIHLEDFNLSQVRQLVAHLQFPDDVTETVTKRIYYWTDGQPYLTQRLCLLLAEKSDPIQFGKLGGMVDKLAKQLHNDESYIQRIKRLSEKEPELLEYVRNIALDHHRPKFNHALNDRHFRLAHVYGVIKADADGHCRIRNRVCEQVLTDIGLDRLH